MGGPAKPPACFSSTQNRPSGEGPASSPYTTPMRFILGSLLIMGATVLFTHGFLFEEAAAAELGDPASASVGHLEEVESNWPYSSTAARARLLRLERGQPLLPSDYGEDVATRAARSARASWRDRPPYILPPLAAAIGAAGLALAVLLPRTRFRGLALLALLGGLGALFPAFSNPECQAEWVAEGSLWVPLMTEMPRISAGMLLASGFLLGAHRAPKS